MNTDIGKRLQKAADLLDVLGGDGKELDFKGIIHLCAQWGVKPIERLSGYDWIETIRALAWHIKKVQEDE